jgi:DNA replication and repair protein RecF
MTFIKSLQLTDFRCYGGARLDNLAPGAVVLYGPNGAGKTNMLEAVSLLSPGRGLRGASAAEIQKQGAETAWAVASVAETLYGETRIGTGRDPATDKRIVRINGETAKSQSALSEYLSCVWLTPQMDRLFIDAPGTRRKFLDRLVFAFDASHSGRITRYENAMSQRSKLLKETLNPDPAWLAGLEAQMAETGVAIAAARLELTGRLQDACNRASASEEFLFPKARLGLRGTVEELLRHAPALEIEDMLKYQFAQSRLQDAQSGGAASGPHKSDLLVSYAAKDMPAAQCSTGEQKALLIGIVLAHARLIAAERGAAPILLLDEVAAHLDETRRAALYDLLLAMKTQVWLTGTDESLFTALRGRGQFFKVENSRLLPERQEQAA